MIYGPITQYNTHSYLFSAKYRPLKTPKDREANPKTSKWQPMLLAHPARANSEGTFPRQRKNTPNKSSTTTIFRTKDLQHFKLDNWKSDPELVDQKTHFEVDLPLGPENWI